MEKILYLSFLFIFSFLLFIHSKERRKKDGSRRDEGKNFFFDKKYIDSFFKNKNK